MKNINYPCRQRNLRRYYKHGKMENKRDDNAYQSFKMQPYASCNSNIKLVKIKITGEKRHEI